MQQITKLVLFFVPAAFALGTTASTPDTVQCASDIIQAKLTCSLKTSTPQLRSISIYNPSNTQINFSLQLNIKPLRDSTQAFDEEALSAPNAFSGESEAQKLFRFMTTNFVHSWPLTGALWQHVPLLLINSLGQGFCDDIATGLNFLAKQNNYESRVYGLNGHVVTEILNPSTHDWEMYDADYGVYFFKNNGQVASAEDLRRDPTLITNPVLRMPTVKQNPYTSAYAALFKATNKPLPGYNYTLASRAVRFAIPPKGRVDFGQNYLGTPLGIESQPLGVPPINLAMTLPTNYTGTQNSFLVTQGISGKGALNVKRMGLDMQTKVITESQTQYSVPSSLLTSAINGYQNFFDSIQILSLNTPLTIYYMLNPLRNKLEASNALILQGNDVSSLIVSFFPYYPTLTKTNSRFIPMGNGNGYTFQAPSSFGCSADSIQHRQGSEAILLEDGKPLSFPHSLHSDVNSIGYGRYSIWDTGTSSQLTIYFSASDNSNPILSQRSYQLICPRGIALGPNQIARVSGKGYAFPVSTSIACSFDSSTQRTISDSVLLEDGRPLPFAHSSHSDIQTLGQGRYSVWTDGVRKAVYFSATDNSDPRNSGHSYTLICR